MITGFVYKIFVDKLRVWVDTFQLFNLLKSFLLLPWQVAEVKDCLKDNHHGQTVLLRIIKSRSLQYPKDSNRSELLAICLVLVQWHRCSLCSGWYFVP